MSNLRNLQHFPTTAKGRKHISLILVFLPKKDTFFDCFLATFGHFFWTISKKSKGAEGVENPKNFENAKNLPTMFQSNILIGLGTWDHVLGSPDPHNYQSYTN